MNIHGIYQLVKEVIVVINILLFERGKTSVSPSSCSILRKLGIITDKSGWCQSTRKFLNLTRKENNHSVEIMRKDDLVHFVFIRFSWQLCLKWAFSPPPQSRPSERAGWLWRLPAGGAWYPHICINQAVQSDYQNRPHHSDVRFQEPKKDTLVIMHLGKELAGLCTQIP